MLIWNPGAGRLNMEGEVREAVRIFEAAGWNIRLERSQSAAHVTELARQAAEAGFEAVFIAGGDGTLGRAVAGLIGTETAVGILPSGTTNVWAQEIGLPATGLRAAVESARRLANGPRLKIDVGLCNGNPFLLWAGFGLDARTVDQLERKRHRFMKQLNEVYYALTILRTSAGWRGTPMHVSTGEQTVQGRFMLIIAGNIRHYGGGLATLSPEGKWDDGKMELWLFHSGTQGGIPTVARHVWNLIRGLHVKDRNVTCLPFREARLTFETEEWMHMDGEPCGQVQTVELAVQARGVWVILPERGT